MLLLLRNSLDASSDGREGGCFTAYTPGARICALKKIGWTQAGLDGQEAGSAGHQLVG
jgi:hypothetical protein